MTTPPTPESPNELALQLDSVTIAFGGLVAVKDISLAVPRGLRGTVIGPNGAGKTTLFRLISGEHFPARGRIHLFGNDVTRWPPFRRARAGLGRTYQVTNLFTSLTVEQNVALAAQAMTPSRYRAWSFFRVRGELAARVEQAITQARLMEYRQHEVRVLSHGQQKQLELAMAIVSNPQLLLLDEPAAGLTSAERALITELVISLPVTMTVLLIEHDLDLAFGLSERIICMNHGEIIADGPPDQVRGDARVQAVYMGVD